VQGNGRLATASLAEEIARLQAEHALGDIAIGGAGLASQAAELGLMDEYRPRVHPALVGGGTPYFPGTTHTASPLRHSGPAHGTTGEPPRPIVIRDGTRPQRTVTSQ
jgi:dihydrofolate reductase